jgi:hypothetical protein
MARKPHRCRGLDLSVKAIMPKFSPRERDANREAVASFPVRIVLPVAPHLCPARQFLSTKRQPPMDFIQLQALPQHGQAGLMIVLAL